MAKNISIIFVVLILVLGLSYFLKKPAGPSKHDAFASCLKDKGAIFYGAFWCPHCREQKTMFGNSAKLLPYVECSTADGRSQLSICKDKGIESYPTWDFQNGTSTERVLGTVDLETLSKKTGCLLPDLNN